MVFSDTSAKNGCIQYIESLCKLGDGGITGDTTLFKQITSYFNQADKKVSMALLRVDKNWKFDDSKYTDFPIASIDVVSNQRDYSLPAATSGGNASTLWRIIKVEILDGANYKEIDLMGVDEDETTDSVLPTKYNLFGSSLRFKELPSANITSGLRVTFQRSGVEFTTASTTEQPGYMDVYHDLPCYDTASTYLLPINPDLANRYSQIFESRLLKLESDWLDRVSTRNRLQGLVRNYE
jgi:hypothetical protein